MHPHWSMGEKKLYYFACMMNKGSLLVIAHWFLDEWLQALNIFLRSR